MAVLRLRLAGPLQAWGGQSRFGVRDTGLEPSKSGVVGLLAAALGRPRGADVTDLGCLRLGVRIDWPGVMRRDYHTVGGDHANRGYGVVTVKGGRTTAVTERYYLADADFLVGLSGDAGLLAACRAALERPHWPLGLGRKAFAPAEPLLLPGAASWVDGDDLLGALVGYPWPRAGLSLAAWARPPESVRFVLEAGPEEMGPGETRHDQPVGAAFAHRRFLPRRVVSFSRRLGDDVPLREGSG